MNAHARETATLNRWIRDAPPASSRRPRLFCLPFAGGGARAFRSWQSLLDDVADVLPVQLPGRENRYREPLATDIDALARSVADGMADHCRSPYLLYGHSMGALLAYRFVHTMAQRGAPLPELLIVAAHRAPHQPPMEPLAHSLPREELVQRLKEFGATPTEILDHAQMLDFFLPVIRSDFALSELAPVYDPDAPLDVPILALGGTDDPLVGRDDLSAWSAHTTLDFRMREFPGGHFFQDEHAARVMMLLREELSRIGMRT